MIADFEFMLIFRIPTRAAEAVGTELAKWQGAVPCTADREWPVGPLMNSSRPCYLAPNRPATPSVFGASEAPFFARVV